MERTAGGNTRRRARRKLELLGQSNDLLFTGVLMRQEDFAEKSFECFFG